MEESSAVGIHIQKPTEEHLKRAADLCERLNRANVNPDVWVAHKARDGIAITLVIKVLEEALEQKDIIRNFWAWGEDVLAKLRETDRMLAIEREHEQRKLAYAHSVEDILEQVALRALRKQEDEKEGPRNE